ncbi:hypothetical protein Y032_0080g1322 [Ancylostoma ceylanicum]|uniref:Peptidase A1 domain-containing protein n=1 Tax=Ancylostoma ceylanicum TaxID=53326 RepID=A0A016TTH5_9BILA|nr:hypothetical protein Y032_0080g1322 [Ancylostoma ceylanicum]
MLITLEGAMYISTFIILTIIWCAAATVYQVPLVKMEFKRDQMMRTGEWAAHVQRRNAEWSDLNAKTHSDKRFRQQDVTNYYDEEYLANISIGTPAQKFQMLLDLKSPYFWVPDYTCAPPVRPKGCEYDTCWTGMACLVFCPKKNHCCFGRRHKRDTYPCRGRKTYDPRDSETIVETDEDFDALFGEFEASGIYSIETVIFGDDRMKHLVAEGIKFGRAKRAYGFHESAMDGVFGLGFVDPHEEDYVPALLQAAELGLVKPIFTIYLKHVGAQVDVHGGVLTLGGIDDVHCDKDVVYVKLAAQSLWSFFISGISIKNFSYNKVMHAESDTKDPFIICPAEIADAIAKEVGAQATTTLTTNHSCITKYLLSSLPRCIHSSQLLLPHLTGGVARQSSKDPLPKMLFPCSITTPMTSTTSTAAQNQSSSCASRIINLPSEV